MDGKPFFSPILTSAIPRDRSSILIILLYVHSECEWSPFVLFISSTFAWNSIAAAVCVLYLSGSTLRLRFTRRRVENSSDRDNFHRFSRSVGSRRHRCSAIVTRRTTSNCLKVYILYLTISPSVSLSLPCPCTAPILAEGGTDDDDQMKSILMGIDNNWAATTRRWCRLSTGDNQASGQCLNKTISFIEINSSPPPPPSSSPWYIYWRPFTEIRISRYQSY